MSWTINRFSSPIHRKSYEKEQMDSQNTSDIEYNGSEHNPIARTPSSLIVVVPTHAPEMNVRAARALLHLLMKAHRRHLDANSSTEEHHGN